MTLDATAAVAFHLLGRKPPEPVVQLAFLTAHRSAAICSPSTDYFSGLDRSPFALEVGEIEGSATIAPSDPAARSAR